MEYNEMGEWEINLREKFKINVGECDQIIIEKMVELEKGIMDRVVYEMGKAGLIERAEEIIKEYGLEYSRWDYKKQIEWRDKFYKRNNIDYYIK